MPKRKLPTNTTELEDAKARLNSAKAEVMRLKAQREVFGKEIMEKQTALQRALLVNQVFGVFS